jgi:uncharacterized protein
MNKTGYYKMDNASIIDITVVPKSSRHEIKVDANGAIRVYLNSPPVDGKANRECIELFSKVLRIPKSCIDIDKGARGKKKRLIIHGMSMDALITALK